MRILFDKNVPLGVRSFLSKHDVRTIAEMGWSDQLKNGELLTIAEKSGFQVLVTSDQNIPYQQNLATRVIAFVVLGSNIWPVVQKHASVIAAAIAAAGRGSYSFVEMPVPPKPRR